MRANATWPIFELSATTTTRRARAISARLVWASTSWWVVRPAPTAMPSTPTSTMSRFRPGQRCLGQRPDQLVGLGAGDAAGHDQLQVGAHRQLGGDVQRVGDDRQPPPVGQRPGAPRWWWCRRSCRWPRPRARARPPPARSGPSAPGGGRCGSAAAARTGRRLRRRRRGCAPAAAAPRAARGRGARWPSETPSSRGQVADPDRPVRGQLLDDAAETFGLAHCCGKSTEWHAPLRWLPSAHFGIKSARYERNRARGGQPARPLAPGRRPRARPGRCPPAACGWRWSAAAHRCTWRSPTRSRASRRGPARPTRSRPRSSRPAARYDALLAISRSGTTSEVLELLRSHRGAPDGGAHRGARQPGRASWRTRSSRCPSPTSGRWCRPGSPARRWCCC